MVNVVTIFANKLAPSAPSYTLSGRAEVKEGTLAPGPGAYSAPLTSTHIRLAAITF